MHLILILFYKWVFRQNGVRSGLKGWCGTTDKSICVGWCSASGLNATECSGGLSVYQWHANAGQMSHSSLVFCVLFEVSVCSASLQGSVKHPNIHTHDLWVKTNLSNHRRICASHVPHHYHLINNTWQSHFITNHQVSNHLNSPTWWLSGECCCALQFGSFMSHTIDPEEKMTFTVSLSWSCQEGSVWTLHIKELFIRIDCCLSLCLRRVICVMTRIRGGGRGHSSKKLNA